jgi:hypothetical protein
VAAPLELLPEQRVRWSARVSRAPGASGASLWRGFESAVRALRRAFTGGPTQWEQVDDAAIEASGKRLAALYSTKTGEDGARLSLALCPLRRASTLAGRF